MHVSGDYDCESKKQLTAILPSVDPETSNSLSLLKPKQITELSIAIKFSY